MNRLLALVREVVQDHPLEEKVLLVADYRDGNNLCEALARQGCPVVNLRPETVTGLAECVAAEHLAAEKISLLTTTQTEALVELVYRQLQAKGQIEYFQGGGPISGLMAALTRAILGLRCCGVGSASLLPRWFVTPAKGRDLVKLLAGYEEQLHRRKLLDQPGLVSLALQILAEESQPAQRIYLLPDFLELYPPERALLERLAGKNLIVLTVQQVLVKSGRGETLPMGNREGSSTPASDLERLPWIEAVAEAPPPLADGSVEIFHSYGCDNEAREVLRRIATAGIPLDQVTVAYAEAGYPEIFDSLCRELDLGLTVAEGIPASLTAPGKLLQGLLDWIGGGYQVADLINMMQDGVLKLADGLSPAEAASLLSGSGIGWGRERYRLLQGQDGAAGELSRLIDWILKQIPVPGAEGECSFHSYSNGLAVILKRCSVTDNDYDQGAKSNLMAALQECGDLEDPTLPVAEILERLGRLLQEKRVAAGRPEPGQLYLTSYRRLLWSDRPVTFVVGLDASFPGSGRQDPVLLDRECLRIDPTLPRATDRLRRERLLMELGLATRRGRLTLSYSSHDPVTNQELYPAAVLLQVFRLLKGEPSLDYTALQRELPIPTGFATPPGEFPLEESEWWLAASAIGPVTREAVRATYPGIARGIVAEEARRELSPTCYDGRIEAEPQLLDPRLTGESVSCSALELLGRCPFAYFIRYRLGINPPDEVGYDPSSWLPANERGALFHTLYCRLLRQVAKRGGGLTADDGRQLHQMADELISEYRERIPVPSELVLDREVAEIHRSCELFIKLEQEAAATPRYMEVPFGMGEAGIEVAGAGLVGPVELELGEDRRLKLAGRIDRIDQIGEGSYAVWDYKSGSSYNYDESKPLCQGRRLQHALYAVAAEAILAQSLGNRPRVLRSGYLFPTTKGEGVRVVYRVPGERVLELVNLLCDLIGEGLYLYTGDANDCTYCDYAPVCRGRGAERGKELRSNEAEPLVALLRRLKNYD